VFLRRGRYAEIGSLCYVIISPA